MNNFRAIATATAATAMTIFIISSVQMSLAAQISVVPAHQIVSKGENFSVNISINPEGCEVFGAQYELHFNNSLLRAIRQVQGSFLSQDGTSTNIFAKEIDNAAGVIKYGESRIGVDHGVTNSGILTTLDFQVIADHGISELRFDIFKLSYPNATGIATTAYNGTCKIVEQTHIPTTPTPTRTPVAGSVSNNNGCTSVTPGSTPVPEQTVAAFPSADVMPNNSPTPVVTPSSAPILTPVAGDTKESSGFEALFSLIALLTIFNIRRRR